MGDPEPLPYLDAAANRTHGAIDLTLEDFALLQDGDSYKAILNKAESNKPWLNNIMARVTGKAIPVPDVPQLKPHMALVADLLKAPAREA